MRAMLLLLDLLVLFVLVSHSQSASNCNDSDLRQCMEQLKLLMNNQDLAFAQTEDELSRACVHLQSAMRCVNDFTHRCLDAQQRDVYQTLTGGAQELMMDFCTPGSEFREKYLSHSKCYKKLSAEYKQCSQDYLNKQESAKKSELPVKDRLRASCCLFDSYRVCTRTAILEKCSSEAADLGESMITKAGGPLVQQHCAGYKHNSENCYASSASISWSCYRLIVLSLIVIVSMNFRRL